jgi:hypothetical protein
MSYGVVVTDEALSDLQRLPHPLQQRLEYEIRRLAQDPVRLSRPSAFPHVPAQCYRLEASHQGGRYFITVLFRYSVDETRIEIFSIPFLQIGPDKP